MTSLVSAFPKKKPKKIFSSLPAQGNVSKQLLCSNHLLPSLSLPVSLLDWVVSPRKEPQNHLRPLTGSFFLSWDKDIYTFAFRFLQNTRNVTLQYYKSTNMFNLFSESGPYFFLLLFYLTP